MSAGFPGVCPLCGGPVESGYLCCGECQSRITLAPYGLVNVTSDDGKSGYLVPPEAVPMAREWLRDDAVDDPTRRNLIEHAEGMMGEE